MGVWDEITKWLSYPSKPTEWLVRGLVSPFGDGGKERGVISAPPPIVQPGSGPLNPNAPFQLPVIKPVDPMQEYLNQLLRGIDAGRPTVQSVQELRRQATKQAGLQFDPQINALIGERSATQGRAKKNRKQIGGLYSDLADQYLGDVKTSKAATADAKKAEKSAFDQLQKSITGQYTNQLESQSQELKNLGLEAALGESTKGQQEDLGFLKSLNATESAAQQRAIDLTGLADSGYFQKGVGIAKQEGAETIADLMQQLEDYMRQTGGELSSLRGQKSSAIEQLVNQLQAGQAQDASQFENNRWNRLLQIAQFQRALTNDNIAQMAKAPNTPTKGLEGAFGVLQDSLGNQASNSMSALMNFLQSQQIREGRFETPNDQIVDMTPENAAYMARQYASQKKLSPQETDALIKAVYAYYGKLR